MYKHHEIWAGHLKLLGTRDRKWVKSTASIVISADITSSLGSRPNPMGAAPWDLGAIICQARWCTRAPGQNVKPSS